LQCSLSATDQWIGFALLEPFAPSLITCRLREKADEEDSDADDEELPLTAEEEASEKALLEKHGQDCEKVSNDKE
jgi:hypothetical protein